MLKEYYRAILNDSIIVKTEQQFASCKSIIESDKKIFEHYDKEIANFMLVINNQEVQKKELNETIKFQNKQLVKQKRKKSIAIACGFITTAVMTYLWIVK